MVAGPEGGISQKAYNHCLIPCFCCFFATPEHFLVDLFCELWYDLSMPSLTPKIIGGHTYYYARYCQRVDGKPKIVRQVYLGKIDDLVAAAERSQQPPSPSKPRSPLSEMSPLFSTLLSDWILSSCSIPSFLPNATRASLSASTCSWLPSIARSPPPAKWALLTGTAKRS